jgi:hypothetical protein
MPRKPGMTEEQILEMFKTKSLRYIGQHGVSINRAREVVKKNA